MEASVCIQCSLNNLRDEDPRILATLGHIPFHYQTQPEPNSDLIGKHALRINVEGTLGMN